jgi:thiol-disulfide isomerase/thioredoxin
VTRRVRILVVVGVLVAVQAGALAIYFGVQRSRASRSKVEFAAQRSSIVERAPAISATRSDGSAVAITWPASTTRIVHFWGTWCAPCVKELPSLLAFGREMRAQGIEVVAIAVDDDWKDIASFFKGDIPPEVVVEADGDARKRLGVSTLPDTYLVAADGSVIERYHGARDWRSSAARERVLAGGKP